MLLSVSVHTCVKLGEMVLVHAKKGWYASSVCMFVYYGGITAMMRQNMHRSWVHWEHGFILLTSKYNTISMYPMFKPLHRCYFANMPWLNNKKQFKGFCFHFCCIRLENNALGPHIENTVIPVKVASQWRLLRSFKNITAVWVFPPHISVYLFT